MAVKVTKAEKKVNYDKKLCKLLDTYQQILIVGADNVGSNQLQMIRKGLRGDSIVLMGKNTMMKRSIRIHAEKTGNNSFLALIPCLVVCFTPFFFIIYILHLIYYVFSYCLFLLCFITAYLFGCVIYRLSFWVFLILVLFLGTREIGTHFDLKCSYVYV